MLGANNFKSNSFPWETISVLYVWESVTSAPAHYQR